MSRADLTVLIFTRNEERHIERCIRSVEPCAKFVILVDGFSTDRTKEIAEGLGARVVQHRHEGKVFNFGREINWGLANVPVATGWTLKLDADEFLTPELAREIAARLPGLEPDVVGLYMKRQVHFMGRWIKWGDYYPVLEPRIWRSGTARYEERFADEQLNFAPGRTLLLDHDMIEQSRIHLAEWTDKHNGYSTREAIDFLMHKHHLVALETIGRLTGNRAERRRWFKERFYYRCPYFLRPLLYFLYRYVLKLGILDGKEGVVWHVLQAFWYRFLVDAKAFQLERTAAREQLSIEEAIRVVFGVDPRVAYQRQLGAEQASSSDA